MSRYSVPGIYQQNGWTSVDVISGPEVLGAVVHSNGMENAPFYVTVEMDT